MKKLESLKGVTKEQVKEMDTSNIQELAKAISIEEHTEALRVYILNILDLVEADSEIIDTNFEN